MTTENKYPVKECDYCDHVGMAFTFMNGETICEKCHSDLPFDSTECRKLIVKQRKRITELESENSNLAVRCNKFNDQLNEALLDADKERLRAEAAEKRLAEVEREKLPNEQGCNRYGLDMAYFRNVINRELNRPLSDYKPDELARVFARLSKTADKSVMFEPEFSSKFAIEQQIKALDDLIKNAPNHRMHGDIRLYFSEYSIKRRAEQLRQQLSGGENDDN